MPISETDISILIPTYRYCDKVGRAVESALDSGAGEIIVTDDRSGDGTMELLASYVDPRLRVYENPRNLGLWENHLEALGYATKPWIKFIQADDYLLPEGLSLYAEAADESVTVVWSCALVTDDETGNVMQYNDLDAPRRLDFDILLEVCIYLGWLLGSPSHMMVRADVIELDPVAWDTNISADLVLGTVAAVQGAVALLPPGAIGQGAHQRQDTLTQGSRLGLKRLVETAAYLQGRPEPALRRFATLWAAINEQRILRTAIGGTFRGKISPVEAARQILHNRALAKGVGADRPLLEAARRFRRDAQPPFDVGAVIDHLQSVRAGTDA